MTVALKPELPASRRQPAGRKSQQRVKEILQAGRDVFSEKGYERATTAEIAQRLGVSEGRVFSCVRGERELCAGVIVDAPARARTTLMFAAASASLPCFICASASSRLRSSKGSSARA